jgi:uncharacterized protein (TIGR00369 family)
MRLDTNFARTIGLRIIEATPQHAVLELDFSPAVQQVTGIFHGGALLTMADSAATWAAIKALNPNGPVDGEPFPLTVQMSTNFLRNTDEGTARAEAKVVHKGKRMLVVETVITDNKGRQMAMVRSTHLLSSPS